MIVTDLKSEHLHPLRSVSKYLSVIAIKPRITAAERLVVVEWQS